MNKLDMNPECEECEKVIDVANSEVSVIICEDCYGRTEFCKCNDCDECMERLEGQDEENFVGNCAECSRVLFDDDEIHCISCFGKKQKSNKKKIKLLAL